MFLENIVAAPIRNCPGYTEIIHYVNELCRAPIVAEEMPAVRFKYFFERYFIRAHRRIPGKQPAVAAAAPRIEKAIRVSDKADVHEPLRKISGSTPIIA